MTVLEAAKPGDDNAFEILLQPLPEPGLANAQLSGDQVGFNAGRVLLAQRLLAIDADLAEIDTQLVESQGESVMKRDKMKGMQARE